LVIFDGPRRLTWRNSSPGQWSPVALWPTTRQVAQVTDHLQSGGTVLILVEQEQTNVPMYAEEAAQAPDALAAKVIEDGEFAEVRIPALDWLPEPLRERGRQFLRDTACFIERQPDLLLPHLLVEEPGQSPWNLRFARLRTLRSFTDDQLRTAANHLFAPAKAALATMETAS
jgi:hypothetical protein